MEKNALSGAQLEIMQIIWKNGGSMMFSELSGELDRRGKSWKTNTVLTFLSRLTERGMLTVKKQGRLNQYVARVSESQYLEEQTRSFIDTVYGGSARHLVSALLGQDYLSGSDYAELKAFWEGEKKDE